MKSRLIKIYLLNLLLIFWVDGIAQSDSLRIDSLKKVLLTEKEDTNKVNTLNELCYQLSNNNINSIKYSTGALSLAKKINYKKGEADCLFIMSLSPTSANNFIQAIDYATNALDSYQGLKDFTGIASADLLLQGNYREAQDYNNSLANAFKGEKIAEEKNIKGYFVFRNHNLAPLFLAEIAQTYVLKNQPDSALFYVEKSLNKKELFNGADWGFPIYLLAYIQQMKGDYPHSLKNYRLAIQLAIANDNANDTLQIYSGMSTLFKNAGQLDSSIYYAQIVKRNWSRETSEIKNLLEAVNNLFNVYKLKGQKDSTLRYLEYYYTLKDSIFSKEGAKQIQAITFNQHVKQEQLKAEQVEYKNKLQAISFTAGLLAMLVISALLFRNNKHKKKANVLLEKQKQKVESTLSELKSTQAQLIQSEKMASLGELTAGIAHEIQNPLNFINNFSEVNKELVDELQNELKAGNAGEAIAISNDIKDNEEKINRHGKRADNIVKGMLQHSQRTSGQKEPTDINVLADEYLRLGYHGMRAKDKNFNATLNTDYDESIGLINSIPQDIGRVLLNLFNNAFYTTNEKAKQQPQGLSAAKAVYEPTISVNTKKINNTVELTVKDNGNGIPQNIVDKIFQPFFTTKPTGQGTGLGLSLSYDIVKAHGGDIKVETKENEGAVFTIILPVNR